MLQTIAIDQVKEALDQFSKVISMKKINTFLRNIFRFERVRNICILHWQQQSKIIKPM